MSLYDKNQILLNYVRDPGKLRYIRNKLILPTSAVNESKLPDYSWAQRQLGETYGKVICASSGIEEIGKEESAFTVLGGWCVLRTNDMLELRRGKLNDSLTNKSIDIRSVEQVAQWLKDTIGLDQIIESVGLYRGKNYLIISEEKLWTEKIIDSLEIFFQRNLSDSEISTLHDAVRHSEDQKYFITKRYIEYVSGKSAKITRLRDIDVFKDILEKRDQLFKDLSISINDLIEPVINRIKSKNSSRNLTDEYNRIYSYVNSYSVSWFLLTSYYFSILKSKGYVNTPYGILINPWTYASSGESEAKSLFYKKVFSGGNEYLNDKGINKNLAYIAIDQPSTYNFKLVRSVDPISKIPNVKNYSNFISKIEENSVLNNIDLSSHEVLNLGINYLPYGKSAKAMSNIINIVLDFRKKRKQLSLDKDTANIFEKRKVYSSHIEKESIVILNELHKLFIQIFG